jgi:hypothetical protein
MQKTEFRTQIIVLILSVVVLLSRMIDHPMNFTPIIALILFSASVVNNKLMKVLIPFGLILVSDIFIEISTGRGFELGSPIVYLAYGVVFLIGFGLIKQPTFQNVILGSFLSSFAFYLITNFALLYPEAAQSDMALGIYSHNLDGIWACYKAGLPFFRNMMAGDLLYSGLLFGGFAFLKNRGWVTA